ncbi:hypothetical protein SCUCBS95973_005335 [Sporothrix curviconia]|uniref:EamA domain-containing protein n=1 Tax=Sporothrix curviconia TaxID=1260050 RepID=A0ABP0BWD5_9PEZI
MASDALPAGAGLDRVQSNSPLLGTPAPAPMTTGFRASIGLAGVGRRSLGIAMLMTTVFLWTASNFFASFIFADNTYSKPFFMVYLNTSVFALSLIPMVLRYVRKHGVRHARRALFVLLGEMREDVRDQISALRRRWRKAARKGGDGANRKLLNEGEGADGVRRRLRGTPSTGLLRNDQDSGYSSYPPMENEAGGSGAGISADRDAATAERLLGGGDSHGHGHGHGLDDGDDDDDDYYDDTASLDADLEAAGAVAAANVPPPGMSASMIIAAAGRYDKLNFRQTTWLSLEFSMLWFSANYLAAACLEHTSVASATIFTSLSSMFTLLFCAAFGVEPFTLRKLLGVVASVVGIALVSSIDLSGKSDENRGAFPHKSPGEIAVGDAMALLSAVVYGAYVTVMKQRVGHEDRVSMPLFFGLVGLFNVLLLWPGFFVLHWTGLETFALPPTEQVWTIILLNSVSSFASDMTWAYAMLLTTPLVVTVGLSLTIPLSLVGEMFQYNRYASGLYWVGALVVVLSFLFVNHESHEPDESLLEDGAAEH